MIEIQVEGKSTQIKSRSLLEFLIPEAKTENEAWFGQYQSRWANGWVTRVSAIVLGLKLEKLPREPTDSALALVSQQPDMVSAQRHQDEREIIRGIPASLNSLVFKA